MVDEVTKKTLAAIPILKTRAGPRDGDPWVQRLKEEYMTLIQVCLCLFPVVWLVEYLWLFLNLVVGRVQMVLVCRWS